MSAFVDLLPFIMPFVRDCNTPAAVAAARFAVVEFYAKSLWQQEQLEPVDLVAGQATYEIELQQQQVAAEVMRVEVDNIKNPLEFVTKDRLDFMYGKDWTTLIGQPRWCTQIEPTDITLVPAPDSIAAGPDPTQPPNQMRLLVAIQPTPDATEFDDSVFNYYAEALAYGARARLLETAGQPYYDPTSAPFCWQRFYAGVSAAKARRMKDHTRAVQSVQLRPWI
jgi:hypothetical protein